MAQISEYAQLALLVYYVNPNNRTKSPSAWNEIEYFPDNSVGFSYGVYDDGSEIVISFTGTNEGVDWLANSNPLPNSPLLPVQLPSYYLLSWGQNGF